ncbi:carbohydrate sulfotransferase 7 [Cetorhinus maximus]
MKLLHSRCLLVIVGYSLLLLAVSYFLDCHHNLPEAPAPPAPQQQPLSPGECAEALAPMSWEELELEADFGAGAGTAAGGRSGKQHIYLHASWRTGSSFAGELFNQHPAVFYLYEPMWLMWQALYPGDAESLQGAVRDMLRSLFRCDFSVLRLYAAAGAPLTTRTVFGWRNNKVICSAPLCGGAYSKERVELVEGGVCERQCAPRDIRELEGECRRYDVMVIKDVRVLDAGVLFPLMRDPALRLKVVQLVRDPRAVHSSRMKSKQSLVRESIQVLRSRLSKADRAQGLGVAGRAQRADAYVSQALEVICQGWSKDQVLVSRSPAWLRSRYLTLRYEDLVLEPLSGLRALYRFANITVTPATERYMLNMTRGVGYSPDQPFLISSRDAKEAVSAWRKRLSHWQVRQVEHRCQAAMKMLGYPPNSVDNT